MKTNKILLTTSTIHVLNLMNKYLLMILLTYFLFFISQISDLSFKMKPQANQVSNEIKQKAEIFHSQGFEARKRGEYNKAIDLYTKAIEIMPSHFKAHFNRGFAYDKLGSYDLAIQDYSQALSIDPNNAYAYYNRGYSLFYIFNLGFLTTERIISMKPLKILHLLFNQIQKRLIFIIIEHLHTESKKIMLQRFKIIPLLLLSINHISKHTVTVPFVMKK